MDSRLGLAIMCGLIFTLSLGQADKNFVSPNMKENMDKLRAHFNLTGATLEEKSTIGRLLAEQESKKFEPTEQKLLLGEMLDVYLNIFSGLLNKTKDPNMRKSLTNLRNNVGNLTKHYFQGKEGDVRKQLHEMEALKTNEPAQLNALDKFEVVYQKASTLGHEGEMKGHQRHHRTCIGRLN